MEDAMIKRIGLLTSGGDCQALNATMRGVVKGLSNSVENLEVYGFDDGYKGLIYGKYRMLTARDFSGILTQGGTILGTSRQPFKLMRVPDEKGLDKVEAMKQTYYKLCLDCLVILGGNGTQKTANLLREEGLNIIHLPKTIDIVWDLRDQNHICSACNTSIQCKASDLMSHDLNNKYTSMRCSCCMDAVNGICCDLQSALEAKGHICIL